MNDHNDTFLNGTYIVCGDDYNPIRITALRMYSLVVHVMVCVLGTTGNGLIIWFCTFKMEKTVTMLWILNLAIADFLFTTFLSLRITYLALNHWPLGRYMHGTFWFLTSLNLNVSILQLTVISVDRCLCVYFPVWCKNHRRIRLAKIIVTAIWIVSVLLHIPKFNFQSTSTDEDSVDCIINHDKTFKWEMVVRLILRCVIFTIIVLCYTAITVRVKRTHIELSSRLFKISVSIIISFFLCYFPFQVFLLFEEFRLQEFSEVHLTIKETTLCLMIANSCINPIIYIFIGRDFKEKFCTSITSVFKKAFTEDVEMIDSRDQKRSSSSHTTSCVASPLTSSTQV